MAKDSKYAAELKGLREEVIAEFTKLNQYEEKRLLFTHGLFLPELVVDEIQESLALTHESIHSLEKIENIIQQALAYELLSSSAGHKTPEFQAVLSRFREMERIFHKLRKTRKREAALLALRLKGFYPVRHLLEWRFYRLLRKESHNLLLLQYIFSKSDAEFRFLQEILKQEQRKEAIADTGRVILTIIPFGIPLLLVLETLYLLGEEYSKNNLKIQKLLEEKTNSWD